MSAGPLTIPADEDLAARGDLVALHERYARRLYVFLSGKGVATSDIDDVAQEVWARVWQALRAKTFEGHFRGWLFRIAGNLVIDRSRRKRADALPDDLTVADAGPGPEEDLERKEEMQRLRECLDKLPEQLGEVLRRRLAGEEHEEIARALQVPVERAHRRLHDARKAVAECVQRGAS
jgi:RNA polymerase sigma-70 factor (ECF subfamily)